MADVPSQPVHAMESRWKFSAEAISEATKCVPAKAQQVGIMECRLNRLKSL